jgi:hypothetical protein
MKKHGSAQKELLFSLLNYNNLTYNNNTGIYTIRKGVVLKLLSKDREQFIKLGNYFFDLKNVLSYSALNRLINLDQKATDLIRLIQKEYHLK